MLEDAAANELLPILEVRYDDRSVADYLLGTARSRGRVYVPLAAPPQTAELHLLQVYVAGEPDPVVMLAQPLGPATPQGSPLELSVFVPRNAIPPALSALAPLPERPSAPAFTYGEAPVVSPSEAPPSRTSDLPDWLEEGRGQLIPSLAPSLPPRHSGPGGSTRPRAHSAPPMAEVSQAVTDLLQSLARTEDPERFAALLAPIEARIRGFIDGGEIAAARRIHATLEMIAHEPAGPRSRAPHASQALAIFTSPPVLASLAARALDAAERDGQAATLLARAGNRGAHALYSARVANPSFDARSRFPGILLGIGAAAIPTIRSALERLEPRLELPGALALAEDVLHGVPEVPDEALGHVIARLAMSPAASLALAAADALPRVWRERARPVLTAHLQRTEDDVCVAALKHLRHLGGVDRVLFAELEPMVLGTRPTRKALRLAAAEALVDSTVEVRPYAHARLTEVFVQTAATTAEIEDFLIVVADSLIRVGGDVALVIDRCRRSPLPLRGRLEAVLHRLSVPGF